MHVAEEASLPELVVMRQCDASTPETRKETMNQQNFPTPWKVVYAGEDKAQFSAADSAQLYVDLHASKLALGATERGFEKAKFSDIYGENCSIQESSLASQSAIWLGVDDHRMHLDRDMAAALIPLLWQFVATGKLR